MDYARKLKDDKDSDYIRVSFTDLNGHHMTKLISNRNAKHLYENKIEIYCGIIGFGPRFELHKPQEVIDFNFSNGYLIPDKSTLHNLPWISKPGRNISSVLCDFKWPNGETMNDYPRAICKRLLSVLRDEFGMKLYSSFEPEFTLLQKDTVDAAIEKNELYPSIKPIYYGTEMYKTLEMDKIQDYFIDMDGYMEANDIQIQDFNSENGPGQVEMPLLPEYGMKSADDYFIMKQSAKEIALKNNMFATFMTRPLISSSISNGCHYNHSLWDIKSGNNLMFSKDDDNNLSEICKNWIGGLIEHLPAMTAITSPTVNCYRRLHQGLAPDLCNWNINDRFFTIRVKNADENRTYVENRSPSSACSPYMGMAITLAAGIDGLRRKLPAKNFNIKDVKKTGKLPNTLSEALVCLEKDIQLSEILSPTFTKWYIGLKKNTDLKVLSDDIKLNTMDSKEIHEYLWLT